MKHLDDLPNRHPNHGIQAKAERAFEALLATSDDLIAQGADRADYGTDFQVEVIDRQSATNVRLHIQLKGTETALNADGSVSVQIRRANLNYLLMQAHSVFVCFHVPTESLRICSADAVVRKYEHAKRNWSDQETLTVTFSDLLSTERLTSWAKLARSSAASSRDARFLQTSARPMDVPSLLRAAPPYVHVPDDTATAATLLHSLYESSQSDRAISAAFDRFLAVLGPEHPAMTCAYMSEINLGMGGPSGNLGRILEAIEFLTAEIGRGRIMPAGLHYSIGNAYSALSRDGEAIPAYEKALASLSPWEGGDLRAQICKNLGTSHERLGNETRALELFREALDYAPYLPEAHSALGHLALKQGEYAEALEHFDQVVYAEGASGRSSVSGWRMNALFNIGDGKSAFREITTLLAYAGDEEWIWGWCARQVASFGRANDENARLSLPFWDRYLKVSPECPGGTRERLLNILYLRQGKDYRGPDYPAFKVQFDAGIGLVEGETAAYLWDRLGHWAEEKDDRVEAERCFRQAYALAQGHYGYCLGTALNFLDRHEEALPLLLEQAEHIQPDEQSWLQLASTYIGLGRPGEAIDAYERAITLNPKSASAWFDLGGVHWNAGAHEKAFGLWEYALAEFPDHELAHRLRRDFSPIL